ncbi:dihydroxy-acid dehydratase [Paenibacillus sp. N3/727]|uniref:dihydroxy-acid dehydratase domain-containing protein n=1 Tax=Paenibacillus sp. N3/727 TaxID=2925845 RepID=UPI001F531E57|nr:dihydroxy-acid dehydratase [Paenibacillus sp. N3/727]UNK19552.1 dihydroxy-acid dehydratase [Paenibacillus sp. N3/727]
MIGIVLDAKLFDDIHRKVPVLVDTKTAGKYPMELFWYADGVPFVMDKIKDFLHLDALTVTGQTVGENIEEMRNNEMRNYEEMFLTNYKLNRRNVIYPLHKPLKTEGSLAVLNGNLAPEGATIKKYAVASDMQVHTGPARVFDSEREAVDAYITKQIYLKRGDTVSVEIEKLGTLTNVFSRKNIYHEMDFEIWDNVYEILF